MARREERRRQRRDRLLRHPFDRLRRDGNVAAACAPAGSAGLPIYTGTQSSFVGTTIDLDAACDLVTGGSGGCAGQTLYIALAGITDCSAHRDGWFLDDVTVTACTP